MLATIMLVVGRSREGCRTGFGAFADVWEIKRERSPSASVCFPLPPSNRGSSGMRGCKRRLVRVLLDPARCSRPLSGEHEGTALYRNLLYTVEGDRGKRKGCSPLRGDNSVLTSQNVRLRGTVGEQCPAKRGPRRRGTERQESSSPQQPDCTAPACHQSLTQGGEAETSLCCCWRAEKRIKGDLLVPHAEGRTLRATGSLSFPRFPSRDAGPPSIHLQERTCFTPRSTQEIPFLY